MKTLEFGKGLQLGIARIDEQHGRFFDLLNRLISADARGEDRELLSGILEELSDYIFDHFRTEEDLMILYGYEDFENHRRQHAEFVGRVMTFYRQFRRGDVGLQAEMLAYMVEWFSVHIREEDPKYVELFHANGV